MYQNNNQGAWIEVDTLFLSWDIWHVFWVQVCHSDLTLSWSEKSVTHNPLVKCIALLKPTITKAGDEIK